MKLTAPWSPIGICHKIAEVAGPLRQHFRDESRLTLSTCDSCEGSEEARENVIMSVTSFSLTGLVVGQ